MSKSEAVVIESIEVRELLRFLFYLYILNKLWLLQRKHSKYMYARCLNFPCFITHLAACIHAFCMFYLYVSLGQTQYYKKQLKLPISSEQKWLADVRYRYRNLDAAKRIFLFLRPRRCRAAEPTTRI